ncbi:Neuron navigator 3, partial [Takifugu flavidus]
QTDTSGSCFSTAEITLAMCVLYMWEKYPDNGCFSSRLPGPSRVSAAGSGVSRSPGSSNLNRRSQSFNSIDKNKPLQYASGNDRGESCLHIAGWSLPPNHWVAAPSQTHESASPRVPNHARFM